MKITVARGLLAWAFILSLAAVAQAQPKPADEDKINQLRTNIQMLVDNPPAQGDPDADQQRGVLLGFRRQLRDLLVEKRGVLKNKLQTFQSPDALPEVLALAEGVKRQLQSVNDEVQKLDGAMGGAPPGPAPVATSSPEVKEGADDGGDKDVERSRDKELFDAAVKNITPADLLAAAAPSEVMDTKMPEPPCSATGQPVAPSGSTTGPSKFDVSICGLARDLTQDDRPILLEQDSVNLFYILIAKLLKTAGDESFVSFVTEAQEMRTDQQIGAAPSSSGTTSLVSKGGLPSVLGFAVENGAAVETRSDTTVTFRVNPGGALSMFANKGFITGFREDEDDPVMKFLRKTSVGLSFDTSRGDQPGVFTGDRQQLSAVSVQLEFVNERDPRHKKYEADWEAFVANQGVEQARNMWTTTLATTNFGGRDATDTFVDPALQAWLNQTNERLAAAGAGLTGQDKINAMATIIREQADLVPVDIVSEQTVNAITNYAKGLESYTREKNRLLNKIARGKILTFEYVNKREVNAPDTSNFNFIAGTGTGRRVSLTANGSITIFHKRPIPLLMTDPRPGRVRDFQFAGQVDIPFIVGDLGQFDFWFGGRYERLMEDAATDLGTVVPNTKGDIAVGQFGLNIPIKGLGMKFPISFTFANRTELIKEKEVRGNFGFTFNLDTLFSRLNPF